MASGDVEVCSNCGKEMLRSEQAYIFEDRIVCADCYTKLREGMGDKEYCAECGRRIREFEKAYVVDGHLLCLECEERARTIEESHSPESRELPAPPDKDASTDLRGVEVCASCGREMPRSEQAFVIDGQIICAQCDKNLRSGAAPTVNSVGYRNRAVISLVLGVIGICEFWLGALLTLAGDPANFVGGFMMLTSLVVGVVGLGIGAVARRRIMQSGHREGVGMAIAGIVLGAVAITLPGLLVLFAGAITAFTLPPGGDRSIASVLLGTVLNPAIILLVSVCTSVWVGIDSCDLMRSIGTEQRRLKSGVMCSPARWVVACIFLWIIAFPLYLVKRRSYIGFERESG